ncbi:uncharacterized protein PADG_06469 [Paracoccidioides brasiliensis Pb18]|uniref:MI domain-containing protein n=1 Tax=Paracoccidioides brasiliensis (strain Pb18) TaxID=502780 RepID=C1GGN2_PARBD|nr:uncharacterized protein PADG_06469 [Paracoccidioides brasiliensis Pb18]EEH50390.2 hypothetical protein PADG_06469 [Paracoccidioides brasiliensis Pb18]
MPRPLYNTTQLPKQLRDELGLSDLADLPRGKGTGDRLRNGYVSRKERRKAERVNVKRAQRAQRAQRGNGGRGGVVDGGDVRNTVSAGEQKQRPTAKLKVGSAPKSKPILKKREQIVNVFEKGESEEENEGGFTDLLNEEEEEEGEDGDDPDEEEMSSGDEQFTTQPKLSQAVKDKLAEDDAEISALEKKLGIKGKKGKLPQSFYDEGLADILGDLAGAGSDGEDESRKRKREEDEWLQRKRMKAQAAARKNKSMGVESGSEREGSEESDESGEEDEFDGFDDDDGGGGGDGNNISNDSGQDDEDTAQKPKKRENPYLPPVSTPTAPPKYIPPSLRNQPPNESESLTLLRRQAQGHLNKLSEANLLSILREIEKLYQDYPRRNVTSTLIELLMGLVYDRSVLQDTFIILHAGFIAAVYKVMGMDFGAELVEAVVRRFDGDYEVARMKGREEKESDGGGSNNKEMLNAISLLSHLYNFHVIGCSLIFDYIRLFLTDITELNTELLLRIIKNSGPQLRADSPSTLKDIILLLQPTFSTLDPSTLSVRTKFMLETITDLKNNRLKSNAASASSLSSTHITTMRKILGSLNDSPRTLRASEPIRIGRADIHRADKRGKWWLVGASWRDDAANQHNGQRDTTVAGAADAHAHAHAVTALADTLNDNDGIGGKEVDLLQLARAHGMNTDVRRSIFVAIMSAADYRDAHMRLAKLRLKRNQEGEIPRVLLHCAMEEEAHNPYYTIIARRLCGERRMKMAFMFSLWDVFKRMGEGGEYGDDDGGGGEGDDEVTSKAIVNLAKMYGSLIAGGEMGLGALKVLDFVYMQSKTRVFVEVLIVTVMTQTQQRRTRELQRERNGSGSRRGRDGGEGDEGFDEKALADVFLRTRETPQIVPRLIYFIRKVVAKTDIVVSKRERRVVKWGCKVALDTLKAVSRAGGDG